MTEAELLAEVTRYCDQLGMLWHHCPDSRRCDGRRGFPDLVIIGWHGVLFAELKSADGETSAEQDAWLWTIAKATMCAGYAIWRPADWESGLIERGLKAIA